MDEKRKVVLLDEEAEDHPAAVEPSRKKTKMKTGVKIAAGLCVIAVCAGAGVFGYQMLKGNAGSQTVADAEKVVSEPRIGVPNREYMMELMESEYDEELGDFVSRIVYAPIDQDGNIIGDVYEDPDEVPIPSWFDESHLSASVKNAVAEDSDTTLAEESEDDEEIQEPSADEEQKEQ